MDTEEIIRSLRHDEVCLVLRANGFTPVKSEDGDKDWLISLWRNGKIEGDIKP